MAVFEDRFRQWVHEEDEAKPPHGFEGRFHQWVQEEDEIRPPRGLEHLDWVTHYPILMHHIEQYQGPLQQFHDEHTASQALKRLSEHFAENVAMQPGMMAQDWETVTAPPPEPGAPSVETEKPVYSSTGIDWLDDVMAQAGSTAGFLSRAIAMGKILGAAQYAAPAAVTHRLAELPIWGQGALRSAAQFTGIRGMETLAMPEEHRPGWRDYLTSATFGATMGALGPGAREVVRHLAPPDVVPEAVYPYLERGVATGLTVAPAIGIQEAVGRAVTPREEWEPFDPIRTGMMIAGLSLLSMGRLAMDPQAKAQALHEWKKIYDRPDMKEMFARLGVSPNATEEEIKRAYRTLAKEMHPDRIRARTGEPATEAQEEAWRQLDEAKRLADEYVDRTPLSQQFIGGIKQHASDWMGRVRRIFSYEAPEAPPPEAPPEGVAPEPLATIDIPGKPPVQIVRGPAGRLTVKGESPFAPTLQPVDTKEPSTPQRIDTVKYGRLTVVDDTDPTMVFVRAEDGREFRIARNVFEELVAKAPAPQTVDTEDYGRLTVVEEGPEGVWVRTEDGVRFVIAKNVFEGMVAKPPPEPQTVDTKDYGRLTVVDDTDPAMVVVRTEEGIQIRIARNVFEGMVAEPEAPTAAPPVEEPPLYTIEVPGREPINIVRGPAGRLTVVSPPTIRAPEPEPTPDVTPERRTIDTQQYGRLTVVDDTDPAMVRVRSEFGIELDIGRDVFDRMVAEAEEAAPEPPLYTIERPGQEPLNIVRGPEGRLTVREGPSLREAIEDPFLTIQSPAPVNELTPEQLDQIEAHLNAKLEEAQQAEAEGRPVIGGVGAVKKDLETVQGLREEAPVVTEEEPLYVIDRPGQPPLSIVRGPEGRFTVRSEEPLTVPVEAPEEVPVEEPEPGVWYRTGEPEQYSEFTFDPTGRGIPRMTGSRDTGVASGQYAYGEPGEGRVPIEAPENPLQISGRTDPLDFQQSAISLMRFAEGEEEGYAGADTRTVAIMMFPYAPSGGIDQTEADIREAIETWQIHKQVHPMNILLNKWGHDGVEYVEEARWAANEGQFGNVKFPPIDEEGQLVGMEHAGGIYMRPVEEPPVEEPTYPDVAEGDRIRFTPRDPDAAVEGIVREVREFDEGQIAYTIRTDDGQKDVRMAESPEQALEFVEVVEKADVEEPPVEEPEPEFTPDEMARIRAAGKRAYDAAMAQVGPTPAGGYITKQEAEQRARQERQQAMEDAKKLIRREKLPAADVADEEKDEADRRERLEKKATFASKAAEEGHDRNIASYLAYNDRPRLERGLLKELFTLEDVKGTLEFAKDNDLLPEDTIRFWEDLALPVLEEEPPIEEPPALVEGDRVSWVDSQGNELTGTVKWTTDFEGLGPRVSIHVDQVGTAAGVPVERVENIPPERLTKIDPEEPETMPDLQPHQQVATEVKTALEAGQLLDWRALFALADTAYGGTQAEGVYAPKDAYDAMELGINLYLKDNPDLFPVAVNPTRAAEVLGRIHLRIMERIPTQTKRTGEGVEFQQFSTPPTLAYLANWVASPLDGDIVLEPSAGIGGLAVFADMAGVQQVLVNELSERRAEILHDMGFDAVYTENAEHLHAILHDKIPAPTLVVMNPPFSSTAGRMEGVRDTKNVYRHVEEAMKLLQDGGRLVAIVGEGLAPGKPAHRDWWREIKEQYTVRANVGISGEEYRKYGTSFGTQLLVIDKSGPTEDPPITGQVDDVRQAIPMLRGVKETREHLQVEPTPDEPARPADPRTGVPDEDRPGPPDRRDPVSPPTPGVRDEDEARPGVAVPDEPVGDEHGGAVRPDLTRPKPPRADEPVPEPPAEPGERPDVRPPEERPEEGEPQPPGGPDVRDTGGGGQPKPDRTDGTLTAEERQAERRGELTDSIFTGDYKPAKLEVEGAQEHPAQISETTAMADSTPPDITYTPDLPRSVVTSGDLSEAQLEAVVYAGQAHQKELPTGERQGFMTGDGTGVGKGRILAGVVLDNFRQGDTKAVWISDKYDDLYQAARRDIEDIGAHDPETLSVDKLHSQKEFGAGEPIGLEDGIVYTAYSTIRHGYAVDKVTGGFSLRKKDPEAYTRFEQLTDWLGEDYDGVIVFDEAHKMQNASGIEKDPSAQAAVGVHLQGMFPKAKVVYASATAFDSPETLAYAERLGLWGKGTAFGTMEDFVNQVSGSGLAGMELIARDAKQQGIYLSRQLSYEGVEYEHKEHELTPEQEQMYETSAEAWQVLFQNYSKALETTGSIKNAQAKRAAKAAFFGAHQRFFNNLLIAMKMPKLIESIEEDMEKGHSSVVQVKSTGEAALADELARIRADDDMTLQDLNLSPVGIIMGYVNNAFPTTKYEDVTYVDDSGKKRTESRPVVDSEGNVVEDPIAVQMKNELLAKLGAMRLPQLPLDMLVTHFGPDKVAEITGRKERVLEDSEGNKYLDSRGVGYLEEEVRRFRDGEKKILVFSGIGSTGVDYHAGLKFENQTLRRHYLLEPGWDVKEVFQGLGRTHRSFQKQPPEYILLTTNLKGEKRFLSTVAQRLNQFGALSRGERGAESAGLFGNEDDLSSPFARSGLADAYIGLYEGRFKADAAFRDILEKMGLAANLLNSEGELADSTTLYNTKTFLNRILGLEPALQNQVFEAFEVCHNEAYQRALETGEVDQGTQNLHADITEVAEEVPLVEREDAADTRYIKLNIKNRLHPVSFDTTRTEFRDGGLAPLDMHIGYFQNQRSGTVVLAVDAGTRTKKSGEVVDIVRLHNQKPGYGRIIEKEKFRQSTYEVIESEEEAKRLWNEKIEELAEYEEETVHMITGALLDIWDKLPTSKIEVKRALTEEGETLLGRIISEKDIDKVLERLDTSRELEPVDLARVPDQIMEEDKVAVLDNGWEIRRVMVSGDHRMELKEKGGPGFFHHDNELREMGLLEEMVDWRTRYFIPVGERAQEVLENLTEHQWNIFKVVPRQDEAVEEEFRVENRLGIDPIPDEFMVELFALAAELEAPARYTGLRAKAPARFTNKHGDERIEARDITDLAHIGHEVAHVIDYRLSGNKYPSTIKDRFPDIQLTEMEMRDELKGAARMVRPPEEDELSEYRRKHTELMADFYTMYLLNTELARDVAPNIAQGFEMALERTPELKAKIDSIIRARQDLKKKIDLSEMRAIEEVERLLPDEYRTEDLLEDIKTIAVHGDRLLELKIMEAGFKELDWKDRIPSEERRWDMGAVVERIHNIKTGKTYEEILETLTPEERQVLKEYRYFTEKQRQDMNRFAREIHSEAEYIKFLEDYMLHYYADSPKKIREFVGRWSKKVPSAHQRTFPTLKEAVEAGFTPLTQDFATLYRKHAEINWKPLVAQAKVHELSQIKNDEGQPIIQKDDHNAPAHWPTIDHPAINRYYARRAEDGTLILWEGKAKVDPDAYKVLKPMFDTPFTWKPLQVTEAFNAWAKNLSLKLSLFHAWNLSEGAMATLGRWFNPLRGLVLFGREAETTEDQERIAATYKHGLEIIQEHPEILRDLVMHGLTLSPIPDAHVGRVQRDIQSMEAKLRDVPGLGKLANMFRRINTYYDKKLWSEYFTGIKAEAAVLLVKEALSDPKTNAKDLTPQEIHEIKEEIMSLLNDEFGGQEWANHMMDSPMFASPKAQQFYRLLFLSPDYTLSNLRIFGRTLKENIPFQERFGGQKHEFYRKYGTRRWITMLLNMFIGYNLLNRALSGRWLWENEPGRRTVIDVTEVMHRAQRVVGTYDPEDERRYYAAPGKQVREILRYFDNPVEYLFGSKFSPAARSILEQVGGVQAGPGAWLMPWAEDDDMPLYREFGERAKALFQKFVPFSLRGNNFALTMPMQRGMGWWQAQRAYEDLLRGQVDPTWWHQFYRQHITNAAELKQQLDEGARLNGLDPERVMREVNVKLRTEYYAEFWDAINRQDYEEADRFARVLLRLGADEQTLRQSGERRGRPALDVERGIAIMP